MDSVQSVPLPVNTTWPSHEVLSIDIDLVFNAQSTDVSSVGLLAPARASLVLNATSWAGSSQVAPPAQSTDKDMLAAAASITQHLMPSLASDSSPYFATESLLREMQSPAVLHAASQRRSGYITVQAPQAVAVHGPKLKRGGQELGVDASEAWRVADATPPSSAVKGGLRWGGGLVDVPADAAVLTATLDHAVDIPLDGVAAAAPAWGEAFVAPQAASATLSPLSMHVSVVQGGVNGALIVRVSKVYQPYTTPKTPGVEAGVFFAPSSAVPAAIAAAVAPGIPQEGGVQPVAPLSDASAIAESLTGHTGAFVVLCSATDAAKCVGRSLRPRGSAAQALLPPVSAAFAPPSAGVSFTRRVTGPGLHREAVYSVQAAIDADQLGVSASGGGVTVGGQCLLALHQRLERTTYIDLDELREISRVGGPGFVSYTHYIDVERPTSASWQHEVLLTHPLPVLDDSQRHWTSPGAAQLAAAWLGSSAPAGSVDAFAPIGASPWAAASARSMMSSAITRNTSSGVWQLHAEIRMPFHVRYQSVGCPEGGQNPAQGGSELFVTPSGRNESTALPLKQGCYGGVHLPLPALHISCDNGQKWTPLRTKNTAWPIPGWCPTRAAQFEPFEGQLPGSALSEASCELTPPLRPVPVGVVSHFSAVSSVTAVCTLGAAALLVLAGVVHSAPLRSAEDERTTSGSHPTDATRDTSNTPEAVAPSKTKARARSTARSRRSS